MKILAISAYKKSGKDTAADLLIQEFGYTRVSFADPLKQNVADQFDIALADTHDQSKKELPILSMRVDPKDAFSKMVSEYMIREFRFRDGTAPVDFCYTIGTDGGFYGTSRSIDIKNAGLKNIDGVRIEPVYATIRSLCILEGSSKRTADSDYWVKQAVAKMQDGNKYVIADLRYKSELSALKMSVKPSDELITVRINRFDTTDSTDSSERDLDDATFDVVIENKSDLNSFLAKIKLLA